MPNCEVIWACDRDPVTLQAFVDNYGIANASRAYTDILADSAVTSVSIAVDHAQHACIAREALIAGKHVLVEKPIALSSGDARALVNLARVNDLRLSSVAQHRFDPIVVEVKNLLDSGALGSIVSIWTTLICGRPATYYADSYWRGTWADEGGSLLINQAFHCVDLMIALGGRPVVLACSSTILKLTEVLETEDVVAGVLRFPNGGLGTIGCTSATQDFWRSRIDLVGSAGSVSFDINHPNVLYHYCLPLNVDDERLRAATNNNSVPPGIDYYGTSHNRQISDFCNSIRENRRPIVDGEDGLATLEVILDMYKVARSLTNFVM